MRRRALLMGGKQEPNTIIGGVGSVITTKSALATKLDISESIIRGFKVVGDDVHFKALTNYNLPTHVFGLDSTITSYLDFEGKVTSLDGLRHFYQSDIRYAIFPSISSTSTDMFNGSKIEEFEGVNIITIGGNSFNGATFLHNIVVPNLTTIGPGGLRLTTSLDFFDAPNLASIGQYGLRDSTATPYLTNVTNLGQEAMYGADYIILEMPSLVNITNSAPFNVMNLVQEAYFEKLESISNSTSLFAGWSSCNLIEMKKMKTYGIYASGGWPQTSYTGFSNLKTGCVIKVHEAIATANAGSPHEAFLWVKANRSAIVEFYDDDGNYVSTL